MQFLLLQPHIYLFDGNRQMIGIAHWTPGPVNQGLNPMYLIAVENVVLGLPEYPERPGNLAHPPSIEQTGDRL